MANRKYATTPHDGIRQLYMRVNDTYKKKQYRQCILETDKCLALYPNDLGMLIVRSRIFALTGKNDAAFTDVCSAIKILPNSGDLLTLRALLEARKGQKQNAYDDLVIAYNLDRTSPSTNLNMGEILLQLDRYKEAAPYLEYAVKNSSGHGEPYYYRALLYKKMGRLKEAEADLRTSKKLKYVPGTDTIETEPRR